MKGFDEFKLSDLNKKYLQGLDFISLHAPCLKEIANDKKQLYKVFSRLESLCHSIGADYIVFHPDYIADVDIFNDFSFKASLENLEREQDFSVDKFMKTLDRHPDLNFCYDIAHAFSFKNNEADCLLDNFSERISHLHISGSDGNRHHLPLQHSPLKFIAFLRKFKNLQVPFMLEIDAVFEKLSFVFDDLALAERYLSFDKF